MNWKRGALAGGAGAVGALIIYAGFAVLEMITLQAGSGFMPFEEVSAGESLHLLFQILMLISSYLVFVSIGGALPLRMLGVPWRRSLLSVAVAYVATFVVLALLGFVISISEPGFVALVFVLSSAMAVLMATHVNRTLLAGVTVAVAAFAFLVALIITGYIGLAAWIILPFVAGATETADQVAT